MGVSRSLLSASFFCEHCQKDTRFLPIHFAVALTGVSRRTIYYWMEHGWIHWRELPSGRRVICQNSLSRQDLETAADCPHAEKFSAKPCKTVQSGKLTRR